jgi:hypothetical protein
VSKKGARSTYPPTAAAENSEVKMATTIAELTKQSGLVFEGSVLRVGAIASRGIEATPEMAVVRIERIFKGPDLFSPFVGKEISVALRDHDRTLPGTRAVFFAEGLHYGDGLAVRELGRVDAAGEVERSVHAAMNDAAEDALRERVAKAVLIVTGVVSETAPADYERLGSEHDPDWWKFVIAVESVEKDIAKTERRRQHPAHITAFFAHSEDVAWYRAPKVTKGQEGVFILHEVEFRSRRAPGPALAHPLDVQPPSEREHIVTLLKGLHE